MGTNFVETNNQLKELYTFFNSDEHKNLINRFASDQRIWHFICMHHTSVVCGKEWWNSSSITLNVLEIYYLQNFKKLNIFTTEVEGIPNQLRPTTTIHLTQMMC